MKALLAATIALTLFLPAVARANDPGVTTIYAPHFCDGSRAGDLEHSVCGEVGYWGRLDSKGSFHFHVAIPTAMAFRQMRYTVDPVSNWDILAPPVECKYTGQQLSPTAFAIIGIGCTFVPFGIAYRIEGT